VLCRLIVKRVFLVSLGLLLFNCGGGSSSAVTSSIGSSDSSVYSWSTGTPESVSLTSANVTAALNYASADQKFTQAVLIIKDGVIIGERYNSISEAEVNSLIAAQSSLASSRSILSSTFGNSSSTKIATSWSMAKSITSMLFGIAEDKGLLSRSTLASAYLTEWQGVSDQRAKITIQNLLDMRSGLYKGCYDATASDEMTNCAASLSSGGSFINASNHLTGCINRQFRLGTYNDADQSSYFAYSNCDTMILGEIFYRATSATIYAYAETNLFSKLDITAHWWRDNSTGGQDNGNYLAYMGIDMTPRDFAKIAQLLVNDGIWENERILSLAYITNIKNVNNYGFQFWNLSQYGLNTSGFTPSVDKFISAIGFDGQYLAIDFTNKIIIVRNSHYYPVQTSGSTSRKVNMSVYDFPSTAPQIVSSLELSNSFNIRIMIETLYN
jgi:CubicO group peptidase (beta-lactamase class C family)